MGRTFTGFIGCEHLGHHNILKYCNRPFKTIEESDKKIIHNCNERTGENGLLHHVGDFCLHSKSETGNGEVLKAQDYIDQLIGNHIFIAGNHDRNKRNSLKTKTEQIIINQNGLRIQVLHDPLYAQIDFDIIIHSHVHKLWKVKELYYRGQIRLMINCGVDVNDFRPISLDEVLSIYYRWKNERSKIKRWEQPNILKELNKGFGKNENDSRTN